MVRRTLCFLVILSAGLGWGWAQTAVQPPVMPKKPKALMLLAAQVNGLHGINHPWHIKANFQTYDPNGKPADQDVFEEWWAGPRKYKISYTSAHFNQTEYRNGASDVVSGDSSQGPLHGKAPLFMRMVHDDLVQPFPAKSLLEKQGYAQTNRTIAGMKMRCVRQVPVESSPSTSPLVNACFPLEAPVARVVFHSGGVYVVFNKFFLADGHYVAGRIFANHSHRPIFTASVVSLDFPSTINDAEFQPGAPTSSSPLPTVAPNVIAGSRIGGQDPKYPQKAKWNGIQGTVTLRAIISKSGDITNLRILSGPPQFWQSAYDSVKTWKYRPYSLNGKPANVQTMITVIYTMDN